ncbi:hypothetical protein ACIBG7_06565 [Nonomuraea sp. NPDC050328]|uniref:hypothetical protein n=1 Tax=Nonomuraea sp. NPDC050328 TaxID=3364361 RepID=UPI0037946396
MSIEKLARVRDEDLRGRATGPGARALLEAVTRETPRRSAGLVRRRFVGGLAVAVALATAAVLTPVVLPGEPARATSYANSAISLERRGDWWVGVVKDPYADVARFNEAFRALGVRMTLNLVPVSPSGVGEVFRISMAPPPGTDDGFFSESLADGGLELRFPVGFPGDGWVMIGRRARAGEQYQNAASADAEGEVLEGVKVDEVTVGDLRPELARRGVTAGFQLVVPQGDGHTLRALDPAQVGDGWWVWDAQVRSADSVTLLVTRDRLPGNPLYEGGKKRR